MSGDHMQVGLGTIAGGCEGCRTACFITQSNESYSLGDQVTVTLVTKSRNFAQMTKSP